MDLLRSLVQPKSDPFEQYNQSIQARNDYHDQLAAETLAAQVEQNDADLADDSGSFFGNLGTGTALRRERSRKFDELLRAHQNGLPTELLSNEFMDADRRYNILNKDNAALSQAATGEASWGQFLKPLAAELITDTVPQVGAAMLTRGLTGSSTAALGAGAALGYQDNIDDVRNQFASDQAAMQHALANPEAARDAMSSAALRNTALDLGPGIIGAQIAKGMGKAAARGQRAGAGEILKGAGAEGLTEVAQDTSTGASISNFVGDDTFSRFDPVSALDSFAGGAIGGGAISGAGAAFNDYVADGHELAADAAKNAGKVVRKGANAAGELFGKASDAVAASPYSGTATNAGKALANMTGLAGKAALQKLRDAAPDVDPSALNAQLEQLARAESLGEVMDSDMFEGLKSTLNKPGVAQSLGLVDASGRATVNMGRMMISGAATQTGKLLDKDWGLENVIGVLRDVADADTMTEAAGDVRDNFTAKQRALDIESWDDMNSRLAGVVDFSNVVDDKARAYLGNLYRKAQAVHSMAVASSDPRDQVAREVAEGVLTGEIDLTRSASHASQIESFARKFARQRNWENVKTKTTDLVDDVKKTFSDSVDMFSNKGSKKNVQAVDEDSDQDYDLNSLASRLERLVPPHNRGKFAAARDALVKQIAENPTELTSGAATAIESLFDNPEARKQAKQVIRKMATADLRKGVGDKSIRNQLYDLMEPETAIAFRQADGLKGMLPKMASFLNDFSGAGHSSARRVFEDAFPDPEKRAAAIEILTGVRDASNQLQDAEARWVSSEMGDATYDESDEPNTSDPDGDDDLAELEKGDILNEFLAVDLDDISDLVSIEPTNFELASHNRQDLGALHPAGVNTESHRRARNLHGVREISGREFFATLDSGATKVIESTADGDKVVRRSLTNMAGFLVNQALQHAGRVLDNKLRAMERGAYTDRRALVYLLKTTPSLAQHLETEEGVTSPREMLAAMDEYAAQQGDFELEHLAPNPSAVQRRYLDTIRALYSEVAKVEKEIELLGGRDTPEAQRAADAAEMTLAKLRQDERGLRKEIASDTVFGPAILTAAAKELAIKSPRSVKQADRQVVEEYTHRVKTFSRMSALINAGADGWQDMISVTVREPSNDWLPAMRDRTAATDTKLKEYGRTNKAGESGYRIHVNFVKDMAGEDAPVRILSSKSMVNATKVDNAVDGKKELMQHTRFYAALADVLMRDDVDYVLIEPDFGVDYYTAKLHSPGQSKDTLAATNAQLERARARAAEFKEQHAAAGGMIRIGKGDVGAPNLPADAFLMPPTAKHPEPILTGSGFDGKAKAGENEIKAKRAPREVQAERKLAEVERPPEADAIERGVADAVKTALDDDFEYQRALAEGSTKAAAIRVGTTIAATNAALAKQVVALQKAIRNGDASKQAALDWVNAMYDQSLASGAEQLTKAARTRSQTGRTKGARDSIENTIERRIAMDEERGGAPSRLSTLAAMYVSEEADHQYAIASDDKFVRQHAWDRWKTYSAMLEAEVAKQDYLTDFSEVERDETYRGEFFEDDEVVGNAYENVRQANAAIEELRSYGLPDTAPAIRNLMYMREAAENRVASIDAREGEYRQKVERATGMNPDPSRILEEGSQAVNQRRRMQERSAAQVNLKRNVSEMSLSEMDSMVEEVDSDDFLQVHKTPAARKFKKDFMERYAAISKARPKTNPSTFDDANKTPAGRAAASARKRIDTLQSNIRAGIGDIVAQTRELYELGFRADKMRNILSSDGELDAAIADLRATLGVSTKADDYSSIRAQNNDFMSKVGRMTSIPALQGQLENKRRLLRDVATGVHRVRKDKAEEMTQALQEEIAAGERRLNALTAVKRGETSDNRATLIALGRLQYLEGVRDTRERVKAKTANPPAATDEQLGDFARRWHERNAAASERGKALFRANSARGMDEQEAMDATHVALMLEYPDLYDLASGNVARVDRAATHRLSRAKRTLDSLRRSLASEEGGFDAMIDRIAAHASTKEGGSQTKTKKNEQATADAAVGRWAEEAKRLANHMLGDDSIDLDFTKTAAEIEGAGDFSIQLNGRGLLRVAVNALVPDSILRHELFHALWSSLDVKQKRIRELKARVEEVASSPMNIGVVLRELVRIDMSRGVSEEEATAKFANALTDKEEAAAYMYQLYSDNNLAVRELLNKPVVAGFMDRIREFAMNLLRLASKTDQVRNLFDSFEEGLFSDPRTRDRFFNLAAGMTAGDRIRDISKPLTTAFDIVTLESLNRIRDVRVPALDELADSIRRKSGSIDGGHDDFVSVRHRLTGQLRNSYADLTKGMSDVEKEDLLDRYQRGIPAADDKSAQLYNVISSLAGGLGRTLMAVDTAVLKRDRVEFIDNMTRNLGVTEKEAYSTFDYLIGSGGFVGQNTNKFEMGYQHKVPRVIKDLFSDDNLPLIADFLVKDLDFTVDRAITQFGHKRAFTHAFPKGLDRYFRDALVQGASKQDVELSRELALQAVGLAGQDVMTASARNLAGWAMFAMNTATLPLALVSQMIDPLAIAARSGKFSDAFKAYGTGLMHLFNQVRRNEGATAGYDLARMLGQIQDEVAVNAMGATALNMSRRLHKWSGKFFKWNGMQGWNDAMRVAASVAGRDYIRRMYQQGDAAALYEMGLGMDDITFDADGNVEMTPTTINALSNYVESSVARADAAYQPGWMGDPRFALLAHLKRFTYAFSNTVLARAEYRMAEHGEVKPYAFLLAGAPVILAADMAKWAAMGIDPSQHWSALQYAQYAMFRSGMAGRASAFVAPDFTGFMKFDLPPALDTLDAAMSLDGDKVLDMTVAGHRFAS